jgi:hypothetical protein
MTPRMRSQGVSRAIFYKKQTFTGICRKIIFSNTSLVMPDNTAFSEILRGLARSRSQTPDISVLQGHIRYNKCKGKGLKPLKPLHFEIGD